MDSHIDAGLDEKPDYRAVLRRNQLYLAPWLPSLIGPGPLNEFIDRGASRGVFLVDITALEAPDGERECIVAAVARPLSEQAKQRICGWAGDVGYRRIWFDDAFAELPDASPERTAETRCASCGASWVDKGTDFWLLVRALGAFPFTCPLCGHDLPQWRVTEDGLELDERHR
jgi:hypothetical protein